MISPRWAKESCVRPCWTHPYKKKKPRRVAASSVITQSALLRLPRELRDMIYEFTDLLPRKQLLRTVLPFPVRTEKVWTCVACDNPAFECYCYRPTLFLVCSKIRDEALDFVFARNLFHLPAEGSHFLMRDLLNLAQVHRNINGPVRPPKNLRSLWAEFLGRLRYLSLSLNKDLLESPTLVSSALQASPRLTEIVLSKHHNLDREVKLDGLLVELAKIPSLTLIKLANGFKAGDDDMVSKITGFPAQLICWCNYGAVWQDSPFRVGDVCFTMLGCLITDNINGPMTEWHQVSGGKKMGVLMDCTVGANDPRKTRPAQAYLSTMCCVRQAVKHWQTWL